MYLAVYISADDALRNGDDKCGEQPFLLSREAISTIRNDDLAPIAAVYTHQRAESAVASTSPKLRISSYTVQGVLKALDKVANWVDAVALALAAIEDGENVTIPPAPESWYKLPPTLEQQAARALTTVRVRSAHTDAIRSPEETHLWAALERYGREALEHAFGAIKGGAIYEAAAQRIADAKAQRERETAERRAAAEAAAAADAANKQRRSEERAAQRRAFLVWLAERGINAPSFVDLVERHDADVLPEIDIWKSIRLWLSREIVGAESDCHFEYPDGCKNHNLKWNITGGTKLAGEAWQRKKRYDAAIKKLALLEGITIETAVNKAAWSCSDCMTTGSSPQYSLTVGTASEDWTVDFRLDVDLVTK